LVKKAFKPEANSGRDHKRPYNLYLKRKPQHPWAALGYIDRWQKMAFIAVKRE